MNKPLFPDPFETDLLLIFPPFQQLISSMESVGIEYIAAYARAQGFDVRIINSGLHGLKTDDIIRMIGRSRFKVLAISTLHWTMREGLRIAKAAKHAHHDCHIILGGIEASLNAEAILTNHPYIDSIGMGEGEIIVSELLSCVSNGSDWRSIDGLSYRDTDSIAFNKKRQLIDPLDSLPFPARDDMSAILNSGGPVCISSSRGCFGCCVFCSVRAFYGLSNGQCWRGRSPSSVVSEICELYEDYGVRLFSFIDETVIGPGALVKGR